MKSSYIKILRTHFDNLPRELQVQIEEFDYMSFSKVQWRGEIAECVFRCSANAEEYPEDSRKFLSQINKLKKLKNKLVD